MRVTLPDAGLGFVIQLALAVPMLAYFRYAPRRESDAEPAAVPWRGLLGLAVAFTLLALVGAWANADYVNPDGLAYLTIAQQYADGKLPVRAYWSPLFSVTIVPFLWLGLDPFLAAHLATALGGLLVLVVMAALARRLGLTPPAQLAASAGVLVLLTPILFRLVIPDALSLGLVLAYLVAVLRVNLSPLRWGAICGITGGVAYLARAYNLPFFLAHFTLSTLLLARQRSLRGLWRGWAVGMAAFGVIALPWVLAISARHGALTIGTSSLGNHALVAPQHPYDELSDRLHARIECWSTHLCPAPDDVLFPWEDPDVGQLVRWRPFESVANLRHQLRVIGVNLVETVAARAAPVAVPLLLWLMVVVWRRPVRWEHGWLALTVVLYSGGYLLTYSEDARYFWVPVTVGLLLLLLWIDEAAPCLPRDWLPHRGAHLLFLIGLLVALVWGPAAGGWVGLLKPDTCFRDGVAAMGPHLQPPIAGSDEIANYAAFINGVRGYGAIDPEIFPPDKTHAMLVQHGVQTFITDTPAVYEARYGYERIAAVQVCDTTYTVLRP